MSYETVIFEITDGIATITMNRPNEANTVNQLFSDELSNIAIECDSNPAIRAAILTGNGKFFSAGGDLSSFANSGDQLSADLKKLTTPFHSALSRFSRMDKPLITAINGPAAGAGLSLAILGDYAIASEKAKFTMAYTAAGLSPDGGSTFLLPRLVGERRAKELMLTNRTLSAEEALNWGMVNEVVAPDALLAQAQKMAAQLATGPTKAYGAVKELVLQSSSNTMETQMEIEARKIAEMGSTEDGKEGINAFLNKRKPEFNGK